MTTPRSSSPPRRAARVAHVHAPAPSGELRDGFKFRGGRLALDLTASLAGRKRETPADLLREPPDLARWLAAAGLGPVAPAPTAEDLIGARELREAIYRLVTGKVHRRPLAIADRSVVNSWAALPAPAPQLTADGRRAWIGADPRTLLAAVARDAVDVIGGEVAHRLRACSGDGCAIVFLDTSRAGQRRWCSMLGCGNRAKVREFRERTSR